MEWGKARQSDNVVRGGGGGLGGGGMRMPLGRFPLGFKGILVLLVIGFFLGINPLDLLSALSGYSPVTPSQYSQQAEPIKSDDLQVKFVRSILGSTEDVWGGYFQQMGRSYEQPKLLLFENYTRSGCGFASDSVGPFYCPSDQRVYLDLSFFRVMETEFNSKEDFARAYVIGHEVGHHVQNLLGMMSNVERAKIAGQPMEGAQGLSVRLELQADCFAGVWANRSQKQLNWLQAGDVEAALNAATQIGDDLLSQRQRGRVVPDSFTHGTSAQRVEWFKKGLSSGDINQCNTFSSKL